MAEPFRGKQFTHSLLLVLCNRLTTCAISLITIAVSTRPVLWPLTAQPACGSSIVWPGCPLVADSHTHNEQTHDVRADDQSRAASLVSIMAHQQG